MVKARRTTDPASEPLTLEEAKAHLKVEVAADDAYITALITAARMTLEEWTGRAFIEQVWEARLDAFPCGDAPIVLPRPPLIAVSLISYIDPNGDQQTLNADLWQEDIFAEPGLVLPAPDGEWPDTQAGRPNAVVVAYTAGYGEDASKVPEPLKQAMRFLIGHFYENREEVVTGTTANEIPSGIAALISTFRILGF